MKMRKTTKKVNIVICCEDMLRAIAEGDIFVDFWMLAQPTVRPHTDPEKEMLPSPFKACPYGCGKALPFDCEENE